MYFTAQLIPYICAFHPHVFYCLLTFEATYTFSLPCGSLTSSTVDKALSNHCRHIHLSPPVLALLELSGDQWFKGENSDAIWRLTLTSAQLSASSMFIIILNLHAYWSLSSLSWAAAQSPLKAELFPTVLGLAKGS